MPLVAHIPLPTFDELRERGENGTSSQTRNEQPDSLLNCHNSQSSRATQPGTLGKPGDPAGTSRHQFTQLTQTALSRSASGFLPALAIARDVHSSGRSPGRRMKHRHPNRGRTPKYRGSAERFTAPRRISQAS